eukprot:11477345-Alexandrium_andersonii.AAC.1
MTAAATWAAKAWSSRRGSSSKGTQAAIKEPEGPGSSAEPAGGAARKTDTVLTWRTSGAPAGDPYGRLGDLAPDGPRKDARLLQNLAQGCAGGAPEPSGLPLGKPQCPRSWTSRRCPAEHMPAPNE